MKLTKGKRAALICFGIFLGFMAVCTVAAKGIYASGLPRVSTVKPYRSGITHEIRVNGTVKQGQEYGVYVEEGLRIAEVSVANGDSFQAGDMLFQIEINDLEDRIEERGLELAKLKAQHSEILEEGKLKQQEYRRTAARAREDYDKTAAEADARISRCRRELEAAQAALARYDQYLADASGSVSSGDYQGNYERQEKRAQLVQAAISCDEALKEAERQKEDSLRTAARAVEDAEASGAGAGAAVKLSALEVEYQTKALEELMELMEGGGWVYAGDSGRVVDCRLKVGERTADGAGILYARSEGEQILEAVFTEEEAKYVSEGQAFEMRDARSGRGTAQLVNLEEGDDGRSYGRFSMDGGRMSIGQKLQLICELRTDAYDACIPVQCLYPEGEESYCVYIAEEREGILGTEWRVRRIRVEVLDRNDFVAAIGSAEITGESRIVSVTDKALHDGAVVRVLQ